MDDAQFALLDSEPSAHRHADVFVRLERWPIYTLVTGVTTVITTFAVFFARDMQRDFAHDKSFVLPTISRTGGQPPTSPVFTLGLHLASFQSTVVFGAVFYRTRSLTRYAPAKAAEQAGSKQGRRRQEMEEPHANRGYMCITYASPSVNRDNPTRAGPAPQAPKDAVGRE